MADGAHARLRREVAELAAAEVLEGPVAVAHRGDEEVGQAVVVDVGERATGRDGVRHAKPRPLGDVLEPPAAQVAPQLARAELRDEVQVGPPIAVHVGRAQSRAVVVVDLLVGLARVVHDPVHEGDAARVPPIGEPEVVERARVRGQGGFLAGALEQPRRRRHGGAFCAPRPAREQEGEAEGEGERRDEEPGGPPAEARHGYRGHYLATSSSTSAVVRSAAPRPANTIFFPALPALPRAASSWCHTSHCAWSGRRPSAGRATAPPRSIRSAASRLMCQSGPRFRGPPKPRGRGPEATPPRGSPPPTKPTRATRNSA